MGLPENGHHFNSSQLPRLYLSSQLIFKLIVPSWWVLIFSQISLPRVFILLLILLTFPFLFLSFRFQESYSHSGWPEQSSLGTTWLVTRMMLSRRQHPWMQSWVSFLVPSRWLTRANSPTLLLIDNHTGFHWRRLTNVGYVCASTESPGSSRPGPTRRASLGGSASLKSGWSAWCHHGLDIMSVTPTSVGMGTTHSSTPRRISSAILVRLSISSFLYSFLHIDTYPWFFFYFFPDAKESEPIRRRRLHEAEMRERASGV